MKVRRHRRRRSRRNPFRRRRGHRRNPGLFSGILAPLKEHGFGFAVGAGFNQVVADPVLARFVPPIAVGPSKIVVGPLVAGLGRKFLPRFSGMWNDLALFMVAVGINDTVASLLGSAPSAAHGFANIYGRRNAMRSIGPTSGIRSIGPTSGAGMQGIGAMTAGEEVYEPYGGDGT